VTGERIFQGSGDWDFILHESYTAGSDDVCGILVKDSARLMFEFSDIERPIFTAQDTLPGPLMNAAVCLVSLIILQLQLIGLQFSVIHYY
jgi:hypothetical protein